MKNKTKEFFRRSFRHSTQKELIELLLDYIEKRDTCQECYFFHKFMEKQKLSDKKCLNF